MQSFAQKIRIAHVLYSFGTGGLEKGIATIVQNASPDMEHIIICLSTSGESARLLPAGSRIIALGKMKGNSLLFIWKLARTLRSLRPDVVHTRNWSGVDGIIAARLAGIRWVIHGEHGWEIKDCNGLNAKRVFIRRLLSKWVCEYTCVSKQMEKWFRDELRLKKSVTQIYNGVDPQKYHPGDDRDRLRLELGLGPNAPVIGVVGRLDPIKDHPTVLRAFETVRKYRPESQLLIVGDGIERKRLEGLAGQGVSFWGNRADVPDILKILDIFVLPSLNEGISNTILEAMATSLPVIATRVGGNPELVEDAHDGFLFDPGDSRSLASALLQYIGHPDLRRQHGCAGRQKVQENFTVQTMVSAYETVYRRLERISHVRSRLF